jgi:hypothetical protein
VGELVHQDQFRLACQCAVQIKLGQTAALVFDAGWGQHFQALQLGFGFLAAMGFHHAHQYLAAFCWRSRAALSMA